MNPRKCFWFGTEQHSEWFATPLQGADSSPAGWDAGGTLLNGGGWGFHSWGSHKTYTYEWPQSSSPQVAQKMKSYRDGTYGRGLLYFLEPATFVTNILPAQWADLSMAIDSGAPTLIPDVQPTAVTTSGAEVNGLPVTSAFYNVTSPPQTTADPSTSVFVPIPEGYTLYLGAFYSATGSAGIFATPVNMNGTLGASSALTPLPSNASKVLMDSFAGVRGVRLWGGRTTNEASSLTATAMLARLIKTSDLPVYGPWTEQLRNRYENPSFEGTTIPLGGQKSSEWSFEGTHSLYVPTTSGYGYGPYGHGPYGHGPS